MITKNQCSIPFLRLFILLVLSTLTNTAFSASYYVAVTGSDQNQGTQSSPWRTVQKAANTAKAGDTVLVGAGTFSEIVNLSLNNGTATQPIEFIGSPGTKIGGFAIDRAFIRIRNFEFTGLAPNDGMLAYLINASDCVVENCVFNRILQNVSAVNMAFNEPGGRPLRLTLNNNRFINCTRTAELNLCGTGHTISNNYFSSQNGYDCIRLHSSSTVIRNNTFENWSRPLGSSLHTDLIQAFSTNREQSMNNIIEGNLAINCAGCQIGNLEDQALQGRISNWQWRNNIFVNIEGAMNIFTPGMKFYNNLFVQSGKNSAGPLIFRESSDRGTADNCEVTNNIFYLCGSNPASTSVGWYGVVGNLTNLVSRNNLVIGSGSGKTKTNVPTSWLNGVDPKFVSVDTGNYRLLADSPAVGAGFPLLTLFQTDYEGFTRTQTWSIGPYELGSSVNPSESAPIAPSAPILRHN